MRKSILTAAALVLASLAPAQAQDAWPTRPVTVIVPWAAGGPVDTVARIITARVSELLGQQLIVENVGGAGGSTGAARAAKASPDGYTVLLSGSAVLAQNPALYKRQLYNPVTDFEHVALHNDSARVLIVRKDFPANTFAEFVAYVKANADKLQYGSPGVGSGGHVCAILFDQAMGVNDHPRAVSRRRPGDAGPARRTARLHVRADFDRDAANPGQHREGLAAFGPNPAPGLESLPTTDAQGMKGLDCGAWGAFSFPKGTPTADRAEARQGDQRRARHAGGAGRATRRSASRRSRRERRSPEYLTQFVKSEIERWGDPIKASGVQIE